MTRHAVVGASLALLVLAPTLGAADKPQILIPDTRVVGSDGSPADDRWPGSMANSLASFVHRRFRACASELTAGDMRVLIGFEKQRQALAAGDDNALAEIAGALGRSGFLMTSTLTQRPGQAEFSVRLLSLKSGNALASAQAEAPQGQYSKAAENAVAALPDLCEPRWHGELTHRYSEDMTGENEDRSGDVYVRSETSHKLNINTSVRVLPTADPDAPRVTVTPSASGEMKHKGQRSNDAVCRSGETERVEGGGYKEEMQQLNTHGPATCDECSAVVSLSVDPEEGRYGMQLRLTGVGYKVQTSYDKTITECGKSQNTHDAVTSDGSWSGGSMEGDGAYQRGQETISGRADRDHTAGPMRVEESVEYSFRAKPLIDWLVLQ